MLRCTHDTALLPSDGHHQEQHQVPAAGPCLTHARSPLAPEVIPWFRSGRCEAVLRTELRRNAGVPRSQARVRERSVARRAGADLGADTKCLLPCHLVEAQPLPFEPVPHGEGVRLVPEDFVDDVRVLEAHVQQGPADRFEGAVGDGGLDEQVRLGAAAETGWVAVEFFVSGVPPVAGHACQRLGVAVGEVAVASAEGPRGGRVLAARCPAQLVGPVLGDNEPEAAFVAHHERRLQRVHGLHRDPCLVPFPGKGACQFEHGAVGDGFAEHLGLENGRRVLVVMAPVDVRGRKGGALVQQLGEEKGSGGAGRCCGHFTGELGVPAAGALLGGADLSFPLLVLGHDVPSTACPRPCRSPAIMIKSGDRASP
ncbi:hypothetical protein DMT42_34170 [Streptomyces actuosus]|uniref:Uncharacterized protein n=1 Tax=Streptomyces actuosus TaxID=1885 RepID=A0A2U9PB73_STRAS|nr:hypothetical protein DMT42_34170 [Streptomyces actuosus]